MMQPTIINYEAHVTIEPVFGERFEEFERCCSAYGFRPAELLLQKTRQETATRSTKDSFCTGHGKEYEALRERVEILVQNLKDAQFAVWRYKIEGIVLDVRMPSLVRIK